MDVLWREAMPARGLCTAHVSLAVGGSFWVFVLLFSVYFCSGFRLNRFERPGQSVGQSIRRSVRKHAGLSDSRAVGRLVHSPFAERQAVSQSVRQCLIYLMSRNRQMRCMFKILGEPESPHEGGGMFKIYGEPESPDEATCFINKYINKNIYIYIYIYIYMLPPPSETPRSAETQHHTWQRLHMHNLETQYFFCATTDT